MLSGASGAGGDPVAPALDAGAAGADSSAAEHGLVGSSDNFVRTLSKIPLLARSDATVLITGETGTGKELFAEAIHAHSARSEKPFIPVNCGALPEHLVENELFGHAKGAYTGAAAHGKGLLAEAEGGTLFLDELNSLSQSAQSKLLRFLQSREYRMLGSTRLMRADVRIIAATNAELRDQVRSGEFREDLYHRLYVLSIELPPLRSRRDDIGLLARHFLARYAAEHGRGDVSMTDTAVAKLSSYAWPGNVRELQSVVQRSLLLSLNAVLDGADIDLPVESSPAAAAPDLYAVPSEVAAEAHLGEVGDDDWETFRDAKARVIKDFEQRYLRRVMNSADGNVTRAAKIAGMQRRDLQRLLRKHEIKAGSTYDG